MLIRRALRRRSVVPLDVYKDLPCQRRKRAPCSHFLLSRAQSPTPLSSSEPFPCFDNTGPPDHQGCQVHARDLTRAGLTGAITAQLLLFTAPTLPWQPRNLGGACEVQCMGMHRCMHRPSSDDAMVEKRRAARILALPRSIQRASRGAHQLAAAHNSKTPFRCQSQLLTPGFFVKLVSARESVGVRTSTLPAA